VDRLADQGQRFLKLGDTCPYALALSSEARKDTARAVEKEYDATAVGHLNTLKRSSKGSANISARSAVKTFKR